MRRPSRIAALLLLLVVLPAHAQKRRAAHYPLEAPPAPRDIYSAAQPTEVQTTHLAFDLTIDFDKRAVRGTATHRIVNHTGARKFIVDGKNLQVSSATIDGAPTRWTTTSTTVGDPITIDIEPATKVVTINYTTVTSSRALNFLTARQTAGNAGPILFTMSQPDHAREWLPVQDSPGVRMTYEATIRVPRGMLALMSAQGNPRAPNTTGTYRFTMNRPIPAYLIALTVGHFEFRELDERTGMYVEPVTAEAAMWDLQHIPRMVDVAERILGPYPWERYDVALIPGFTAGGMENPELNFINAAGVITGNRDPQPMPSGVIAHELAHSWGGDLATCGTWGDMWLNEGFATYFQKRIEEEVVDLEYAELGYYFDRNSYASYMTATRQNPVFQVLHREFKPGDTLSVFSTTNYQKGSLFLKTLEDRLGRPRFDAFLREYFTRFAYRWVDANAFLETLAAYDPELQIDEWVFGPGLPSNVTVPVNAALWDRIGVQVAAVRNGAPASSIDTTGWRAIERLLFVWQGADILARDMAGIDAAIGLSQWNRPPMQWMISSCETMYQPGLAAVDRFLQLNLFDVVNLYDRLSKTAAGRAWAVQKYKQYRDRYSTAVQSYVDGIIGRPAGTESWLEAA